MRIMSFMFDSQNILRTHWQETLRQTWMKSKSDVNVWIFSEHGMVIVRWALMYIRMVNTF